MLVYPDHPKRWKLVDQAQNIQAWNQASKIMNTLSEMNFCDYGAIWDEGSGIPYFQFDKHAQPIFYTWITKLEDKLRHDSDDPILIEHLAKYRKLMPSLALIFHLIDTANAKAKNVQYPRLIPGTCILRAAGWCDYLETHARRIYESSLNLTYQAARKLARKIKSGQLGYEAGLS